MQYHFYTEAMFTVTARLRHQIDPIKGSRFITTLAPVSSEAEAKALVVDVSSEMSDASHHCTAWRIARPNVDRCGDDGEPSGSAGRPILAQLKGRELVNVAVVVTRYFGGTKLGVGGLVRAYGGAAAAALDEAEVVAYRPQTQVRITVDYSDAEPVQRAIDDTGGKVIATSYEQAVGFTVMVAVSSINDLTDAVAGATAGRALVEHGDVGG